MEACSADFFDGHLDIISLGNTGVLEDCHLEGVAPPEKGVALAFLFLLWSLMLTGPLFLFQLVDFILLYLAGASSLGALSTALGGGTISTALD